MEKVLLIIIAGNVNNHKILYAIIKIKSTIFKYVLILIYKTCYLNYVYLNICIIIVLDNYLFKLCIQTYFNNNLLKIVFEKYEDNNLIIEKDVTTFIFKVLPDDMLLLS